LFSIVIARRYSDEAIYQHIVFYEIAEFIPIIISGDYLAMTDQFMIMNTSIFKAYDIRGIYPNDLNEDLAYRIAQAYVKIIKPQGKVAIGMDVRLHSPQLRGAVIKGLIEAGIDVLDIGLISTEMLYFAVGYYGLAGGIQITASHNSAEWNGMKMVREKVKPISSDNGIFEIRDTILANQDKIASDLIGQIEKKDVLDDFVIFCLNKFVDVAKIKPLKLVYNPSFGFGGEVLKRAVELGNLPIELAGLNDTPDGSFPKGRPDPSREENRGEFVQKVIEREADLGVAWDADADRVFFCTKDGKFVEPYFMNALFIKYILEKNSSSKIIYDPRYTWALIDSAKENGGEALIERVGHSFIKEKMAQENAIFSGESSGHTYFRDFWYADSGLIPLLIVLEIVSNNSLDDLLDPLWNKYIISGEINQQLDNRELADKIIKQIKEKYSDAQIDLTDGLSIEYNRDWRANIRASNTEPLLRLNVEAKSRELMEEKRDEILDYIKHIT